MMTRNILAYGLIMGILAMASGCAKPARPDMMAVRPVTTISKSSPLYMGIALSKVRGGEETNPALTSKVGNMELRPAIETSLQQNNLLSPTGKPARFRLEVFLLELKQPMVGFTMHVESFIRYRLIRTDDGHVVFDDIISAPATATMDDAFYGPERLQIANERSVHNNIRQFIERLLRAFGEEAGQSP